MSSTASSGMGYESQQGPLVGMQVFLLLVALVMCSLRIYSRLTIVHSLGPDDYIMALATVLSLGLTINACLGANYGWGLHIVDLQPANYVRVLQIGWVAQILFTLTTSAMKISILTFYLRLANTTTYKRVIYASIVWLSIWCITFLFVVIFQCNPISAYWIPSYGNANPKCFNADVPLLVNGVTNILNDLFVYVLPMPMLWRVQLPKKQRIGLLALFGVGSLVNIAGGLRLYYSIVVNDSHDGTWAGFQLWTWEAVEVDLGIACACAPALKPLLLRWFPKLMHSVFGANSSSNPSRKGLSAGGNATFIPMNAPSGMARSRNAGGLYGEGETRTHVYAGKFDRGFSGHKEGGSEESLTDHSVLGGMESRRL